MRRFPRRLALPGSAIALGMLLAACGGGGAPTTPSEDAAMSAEAIAFTTELQAWREQRRASLIAPDGWASLVGLHWIERGAHFVGSGARNGPRLTPEPTRRTP